MDLCGGEEAGLEIRGSFSLSLWERAGVRAYAKTNLVSQMCRDRSSLVRDPVSFVQQ